MHPLNNHDDEADYWFGFRAAPNSSRRVTQASEAVHTEQKELLSALKCDYPLGERVQVIHDRGSFFGTVAGWGHSGCRVMVLNEVTQKLSKWWAAHVQLCNASTLADAFESPPRPHTAACNHTQSRTSASVYVRTTGIGPGSSGRAAMRE